ncbi:MAG: glutamine synthetase [Pirellulaceae bacterium]|nr:MAG: glutamine synthetase [Pirellulaceae bacterium]
MMHRFPRPRSPQDVLVLCREHDVSMVELRFLDLRGNHHGVWLPASQFSKQVFENGVRHVPSLPLDFQLGELPDLLLVPQPETVWIAPHWHSMTAVLLCERQDPVTREEVADDGRTIARRAWQYMAQAGIADELLIAPEIEVELSPTAAAFLQSDGQSAALSLSPTSGRGEQRVAPRPSTWSDELLQFLQFCDQSGLDIQACSWDGRLATRFRIQLRPAPLLTAADHMVVFESLLGAPWSSGIAPDKTEAAARGIRLAHLRIQLAIIKQDRSLLAGAGYAGLSETGLHAVGGLMRHLPAIQALTFPVADAHVASPSPVFGVGQCRMDAVCRIPAGSPDPRERMIEFQLPQGRFNCYVAFAAVAMALVDGIQNKVSPPPPLDGQSQEGANAPSRPAFLEPNEAQAALDRDYRFLTRGDVFSDRLLQSWIASAAATTTD